MKSNIKLDQLIELSLQSSVDDPIDWGDILINEKEVYNLLGSASLAMYHKMSDKYTDEIFLAAILKLNVENFVLKQKMYKLEETILKLTT